jgi:hypothetical protein
MKCSSSRKNKTNACGAEKSPEQFYTSTITSSGYDNLCKICRQEVKKRYNHSPKGKETMARLDSNPARILAKKLYAETHKPERNVYEKKKRNADPLYKLKHSIRTRTNNFFRNKGKARNTKMTKLLGCSWAELKAHIEAKFTEGMTWENHGEWHNDHIRPLASFDLTNPFELAQAFHYTNLQPLWGLDNIRKGKKY